MRREDVWARFGPFVVPVDQRLPDYSPVRRQFRSVAQDLADTYPDSRELSLAMTHLEEAMMWTLVAAARAAGYALRPEPT